MHKAEKIHNQFIKDTENGKRKSPLKAVRILTPL